MQPNRYVLVIITCGLCLLWLANNYNDWRHHNIEAWPEFYNEQNKTWMKPKDLLNLDQVHEPSIDYIESRSPESALNEALLILQVASPLNRHEYLYKYPQDELISGGPMVNQSLCSQDLGWIMAAIKQNPNFRANRGRIAHELTRYVDSFGKPKPGTFSDGAIYWLPNEDYCSDASLDNNRIKNRYCVGRFVLNSWPEMKPFETRINVGLCLPETCDSRSFQHEGPRIEQLAKQDFPEYYKTEMVLKSLFCLPDERSALRRLPTRSWLFLIASGIWLTLVFVATLMDTRQRKVNKAIQANSLPLTIQGKPNCPETLECQSTTQCSGYNFVTTHIVNILSVKQSFKSLLNTRSLKRDQKVDLRYIDCIKTIMILMVILGHSTIMPIFWQPNMKRMIKLAVQEYCWVMMSYVRSNDIFFMLSGLVISYNLLDKYDAKQLGNPLLWLKTNMIMTLRLAPLFALVSIYIKLIVPYQFSGRWWDYGVSPHGRRDCIESPWWLLLPQLSMNLQVPLRLCNPPAWFLSCYTQLILIVPPLIYVISRMPNTVARISLVAFISFVSSLDPSMRLLKQDVIEFEQINKYGVMMIGIVDKYETIGYFDSLCRLVNIAIGCLVGSLLLSYQRGTIDKWPIWLTKRSVVASISVILAILSLMPVWSHKLYTLGGSITPGWSSIFVLNILNLIWPASLAILLLLGSSTWSHTKLVRFMSHDIWHITNKLGFIMFLVHWEILMIVVYYDPEQVSLFGMVIISVFVCVSTFVLSIVIYLLFQSQIQRFIKLLIN